MLPASAQNPYDSKASERLRVKPERGSRCLRDLALELGRRNEEKERDKHFYSKIIREMF